MKRDGGVATPGLFSRLPWCEPGSGRPLQPVISALTPGGAPISGALRVAGSDEAYPVIDCVARLTPQLASAHNAWLATLGFRAPAITGVEFQPESTVESFGWQWTWNSRMRSEADLKIRVADKFRVAPEEFKGKLVLDAGAGSGDQSDYLLRQGAQVVSLDLSAAIEVVARKLRMVPGWAGAQADILHLPFGGDCFDVVYCEGVLQHTADSVAAVRELCRVLRPGGRLLASHYIRIPPATAARRLRRRVTQAYYEFLRRRLSRLERFKLLFLTGSLAALSYVPLLGRVLRMTGTVLYYDVMPDFKTTWTNTFDYYGNHGFQRFITPERFRNYFEGAGGMEISLQDKGVIVARKRP